jgi:hypothetical protein
MPRCVVEVRAKGGGTHATRHFAHEFTHSVDGVGVLLIVIDEVPNFAQAFIHQKHARVEVFHKSFAANHRHVRNQNGFKTSTATPGNKQADFAHDEDIIFREVVR